MGKSMGYYPKGPKNQHKELASGGALRKANTKDMECCDGWGKGSSHPGSVRKSGTSTGSGRGGVPKSTFTPA